MAERGQPNEIDLDRLQLNLVNPRHQEVEGRDEAMIELLQKEQVLELARDIVELGGINPMERMGVFPTEGTEGEEEPFYTTAEGNRRLCALILLNDPDAIPAEMPNRSRYVRLFSRLAAQIDPIETVPCIVFNTMDAARPWLERLHNGARDGSGRRRWTPEQQARNTGDRTNRAATQLRDLAIALGMVTTEQLARTTTTQQRFITNTRFRQAMGLVRLEDGSLERTSCWADFDLMLRQFINDIVTGTINSRSHNNRRQIEDYAQSLEEIAGLERRNIPQGPLERRENEAEGAADDFEGHQNHGEPGADRDPDDEVVEDVDDTDNENEEDIEPERRRRRNVIGEDAEIVAALHRLGNQKLIDLYFSISRVRHPQHTLLAVIGCWSFLESLTRAHGRGERNAFDAYINGQVQALGVENNPERGLRRLSLDWISNGGNVTKHDWQGAAYDPRQLFNAMDALKPIIVALLDDIADKKI